MRKTSFNAEYYRRYYENRSTAVVTAAAARAEVRFPLRLEKLERFDPFALEVR